MRERQLFSHDPSENHSKLRPNMWNKINNLSKCLVAVTCRSGSADEAICRIACVGLNRFLVPPPREW